VNGGVEPSHGSEVTTDHGVGTELRRTARVLYTLLKKEVLVRIRYPVNLLGGLVTMVFFFALIVAGGRRVGGPEFGGTLGGLVVGYLVFMLALTAYSGLARSVTNEAQWGTLERLHMSPLGFGRVMILQGVAVVLVSAIQIALILPPMLVIAGESLSLDPLTVVPLATLGIASVLGVGFAFAGASVVYKRIESVFQLVQFGFIPLIAAPQEVTTLRLLPVVQANYLLGQAMREGTRLWEFPLADLGLLVAVGAGYFVAGYAAFLLFVRRARRLGVLGDY
jgi:ABC-2 type transport system permease protein